MSAVTRLKVLVASILPFSIGALCAEAFKATSCTQTAPVCAAKAGVRHSYWNACRASREGAAIVLARECPFHLIQPVAKGAGAVASRRSRLAR